MSSLLSRLKEIRKLHPTFKEEAERIKTGKPTVKRNSSRKPTGKPTRKSTLNNIRYAYT